MKSNPAQSLIEAVGHQALRDHIGLTERNLRHARSVGYFAAQWYAPIKELAESRGVFCPLEAFSFKRPANKLGNATPQHQVPVKGSRQSQIGGTYPTGDA